jgi:hypothetical protein
MYDKEIGELLQPIFVDKKSSIIPKVLQKEIPLEKLAEVSQAAAKSILEKVKLQRNFRHSLTNLGERKRQ